MAHKRHMADIFKRLKPLGFDQRFVRTALLPDWWEDALAETASNRALAEAAIARHLGIDLSALRHPSASLRLPPLKHLKLKSAKGTKPAQLQAAIVVGQRIAHLAATLCPDVPPFVGPGDARGVRDCILQKHAWVDLPALLDFCWSHGIVVVHVCDLPKAAGGKKFHGMALFDEAVPVIVLASGHDSPPWLAFHLAHELGHILRGHVRAGSDVLVDSDLDTVNDDSQETEADRFACEIITGKPELSFDALYGLTGPKLAARASQIGQQQGVDPGSIALIYGRSAARFPAAQKALKHLGQEDGAHEMITAALLAHVHLDVAPESNRQFFEAVVLQEHCVAP